MILSHITDIKPSGNIIDTMKSAGIATRDSVHFTVNHGVAPLYEQGISWNKKRLAILIPMKTALKDKANTFIGGHGADFYSQGPVRIPKGSVIVRRTYRLKGGKYRILNAEQVQGFESLKGCTVIETSQKNMSEAVNDIIAKMGYQFQKSSDGFFWGNPNSNNLNRNLKYTKLFKEFLQKRGMRHMIHNATPNCSMEFVLFDMMLRSKYTDSWTLKYGEGLFIDAKEEILKSLSLVKEHAKNTKLPNDYDIDTISKVIRESDTPKIAYEKLQNIGLSSSEKMADPVFLSCLDELKKKKPDTVFASITLNIKNITCNDITFETNKKAADFYDNPNGNTLMAFIDEGKKARDKMACLKQEFLSYFA